MTERTYIVLVSRGPGIGKRTVYGFDALTDDLSRVLTKPLKPALVARLRALEPQKRVIIGGRVQIDRFQ